MPQQKKATFNRPPRYLSGLDAFLTLRDKRIGKFGVREELVVGQRFEERDHRRFLLRREVQPFGAGSGGVIAAKKVVQVRMNLDARIVEFDDFVQGLETTIMHVRSADFDVSQ